MNANLELAPATIIIAHERVRETVSQDRTVLGENCPALPPEARPVITYTDRLTIHAGGEAMRLVHYPRAHTGGDTVVFWDRSKVVHLGDMFFNGMFPFLDVDDGGSIGNWVKQLDLILAEIDGQWTVIPGHGPLAKRDDLLAFRQMLADSAEVVRPQIQAGKTLAEIQAAGLPPRFGPWTKGFLSTPDWLALVCHSLRKDSQ